MTLSAADIIARLELRPHPEGGYYRETFRDKRVDENGRAHSTAIYFLLARGDRSHWHRVDAVEIWHYYAIENGVDFVFVDRTGFGEYQLVHSTKRGELRDDDWQRFLQ